ncbi:hypothetical protein WA026_011640 [Henosepilachna vigintioctopunctata]|uniref:Uncharacterized protein n=1 Tax=Henosepilachna vigintioctopunctata TaxID=420089 RepID=A0AAW1TUA2_9CUCU
MPELDGNHKVGTGNIKKGKDFANDSDELTSCTPPTTPTDLSDQETTKNDHKVEENKTQKKSNVAGGEADGDTFFSSGEMEIDTGSEYFSAEESTYGVKESNVRSPPVASHFQGTYSNSTLSKDNGSEFVTEEGRRKSIEEDIADSLKISTKSQETMVTIDAVKKGGHHRCISMCEDQIIDKEVQEILKGKEPYQLQSENSSLKDSAKSAEFQTYNQKLMDDKHILEHSGTPSNQNNSGLDANTVVDEIMSTSKLDFLDTELRTTGKIQNIETAGAKVHLEENILNMKNSNQDFFIQSKTTILDVEIPGETFSKIDDETSKTTDTPEQRNLIDYIVPKPASIETASSDGCNPSREAQRIDEGLGATSIRENESTANTPKWYVPFESSPQELTDPSRGNSDGLYIALSDETKLPHVKTESQSQDFNSTTGATKKSCAYININGDRGAIDEGWPNHLPKNQHENNMSGLGLLNTVSPNGHRCIIHEEPTQVSSNKPAEKIQEEIPNFELPNMDKRLTRRRNLKRRQIKSLDSGVHGYYGEYIDLVEFPDLEGGQKMTQDEEQKTNDDNANKNEIMDREVKEIKIEEDVVTILPDGSIREEKIVIDKISST